MSGRNSITTFSCNFHMHGKKPADGCAWIWVSLAWVTLKWGFRLSQNYIASTRIGVRSKVIHSVVMNALVLAAVCDLLNTGFLRDLINCYTSQLKEAVANKHMWQLRLKLISPTPKWGWTTEFSQKPKFVIAVSILFFSLLWCFYSLIKLCLRQ